MSNIRFQFDPSRPSGSRIVSVEVDGEPLDNDRMYVLATRGYMVRGKDGYRSLLVQSAGGECEEVVSEENGMLISAMLRQYFMSLTVLARWKKHWGPSLDRHWCVALCLSPLRSPLVLTEPNRSKVAADVAKSHPLLGNPSASPTTAAKRRRPAELWRTKSSGWADWTPDMLRQRRSSVRPADDDDSDSESGEEEERASADARDVDRELAIMRRVFRKWCRLAGVDDKTCDDLAESELDVDWTKAIAPRVEGRIRMVSGDAAGSSA